MQGIMILQLKTACGDPGGGEIPMESARNRPLDENTLNT